MKRVIKVFTVCCGLMMTTPCMAQDVNIEFYTPNIVHVVKGKPTKTLVITAKPENVKTVRKGNTWMSSELTVKEDVNGSLTFLTAAGKVLLREKNGDVMKARQTFLLDKDEPIYGLGTIQNGKMNLRVSISGWNSRT